MDGWRKGCGRVAPGCCCVVPACMFVDIHVCIYIYSRCLLLDSWGAPGSGGAAAVPALISEGPAAGKFRGRGGAAPELTWGS